MKKEPEVPKEYPAAKCIQRKCRAPCNLCGRGQWIEKKPLRPAPKPLTP